MAPRVSILVPCYNERLHVGDLLEALRGQEFPLAEMEVVVADGQSSDGTQEVIQSFASAHPELRIHLLENPERSIPAALNRALARAQGEIVLRLDAHSVPDRAYVRTCLEVLRTTRAANAGGVWHIEPGAPGWVGRAIAAAGGHWLGAGDARYRTAGRAGPVETVPFGAFPRTWLEKVGGYDESLETNEDYELNHRILASGGVVWFDPAIRSVYRARPTLADLRRQYFRYGFWKARMLRLYPASLRWRQALPPLFVASLSVGIAALAWTPVAARVLGLEFGVYALVLLLFAAAEAARRRDGLMILGFPLAVITMHFAWGGGFWAGLLGMRRPPR